MPQPSTTMNTHTVCFQCFCYVNLMASWMHFVSVWGVLCLKNGAKAPQDETKEAPRHSKWSPKTPKVSLKVPTVSSKVPK